MPRIRRARKRLGLARRTSWIILSLAGAFRLGPPDPSAPNHPARLELLRIIETEPGIHFSELVRRFHHGSGATQHHLRKLVDDGFVTEQVGTGYTCYFRRGAVDRRIMACSMTLRSPRARLVLDHVRTQPGITPAQIARDTSLHPRVVHYHLHRMGSFGLVTMEPRGRSHLLYVTDVGEEALRQANGPDASPSSVHAEWTGLGPEADSALDDA